MALTVRLWPEAERALNAAAKRRGLSRSDVVREALAQYVAGEPADPHTRPYDAWVDVIGVVNVGVRDTGRTTGEQFAAELRARSGKQRAR
ncbi:MAG TPA: CopG family transcriptional regulator [Vicinamibacterales bacterium]|nr:CopG family transcriptional regulator [Vicinamibacterales bacterium]